MLITIKDAVAARFAALCIQRGIKFNELATLSGVTPSTIYSLMDDSQRDVSVITVKKLCDGLDISLSEFFNAPEFDFLEQEIK
jgi:DNA-binding Xre family transcriptional regulator